MSRFTDLFQEPPAAPEPTPEPQKVEEVAKETPTVRFQPIEVKKKKFTME